MRDQDSKQVNHENMPKQIKILAGLIVFLGVISGIFLLTAKRKTPSPVAPKTVQQNRPAAPVAKKAAPKNDQAAQERKKLAVSDWQKCKEKTLASDSGLIWGIQISEGIPVGGTYAKGVLNNDGNFPVRVIIKSDSPNAEKIKSLLVVGKMPLLRGNCTDVAPDGAVVFQAF